MVQELHEEWFPVRYDDSFYDTLVDTHNKKYCLRTQKQASDADTGDLLSSKAEKFYVNATVAVSCSSRTMMDVEMQGSNDVYDIESGQLAKNNSEHQTIVGCIITAFLRCTHKECTDLYPLIIHDPFKYPEMLYIMTLGTARPFRRCGLGKEMVQQCIKLGETNKRCGAVYLNVITHNQAAIKFYENLGFLRITTIKDYYNIDDVDYDCYVYAKAVNGNHMPPNGWIFQRLSDLLYSTFRGIAHSFSSLLASVRASEYERAAPASVE